jgi:hypothetical protein
MDDLYLTVEVSYGTTWVNLNDGVQFKIGAEGTRDTSARTYRKVTADSPILDGNYLIHAVPEMVSESINVWVYGGNHTQLGENLKLLDMVFSQYAYQIRWTTEEYRETWNCQLADSSVSSGHVWTHNKMAQATFTVPRYPDVLRETYA